jgi:hypothetical protein
LVLLFNKPGEAITMTDLPTLASLIYNNDNFLYRFQASLIPVIGGGDASHPAPNGNGGGHDW